MAEKLTVNLDNLVIRPIDTIAELPDDPKVVEDIQKHNWMFINQKVIPMILNTMIKPCDCQMDRMIQRSMTRAKLLGNPIAPGKVPIEITQEDVDENIYYVTLFADNGKFRDIICCVRECKVCRLLTTRGNGEFYSQLLSEAASNYIDAMGLEFQNSQQKTGDIEDDSVKTTDSENEAHDVASFPGLSYEEVGESKQ